MIKTIWKGIKDFCDIWTKKDIFLIICILSNSFTIYGIMTGNVATWLISSFVEGIFIYLLMKEFG